MQSEGRTDGQPDRPEHMMWALKRQSHQFRRGESEKLNIRSLLN